MVFGRGGEEEEESGEVRKRKGVGKGEKGGVNGGLRLGWGEASFGGVGWS